MSLLEDLKGAINGYLNRSKGNTLRSLSMRSGVPYSTLYKIYSGEIENPQLDTVMKLLREGVDARAERVHFIKMHYPHMYELMDLSGKLPKEPLLRRENDPEIDALFRERDAFFLLYHLFSNCGITMEAAKDAYGEHGLTILKDLEASDLVCYQDAVWRANFAYDFSTLEASKQHILNAVSGFNQESVELGCGLLHSLSEGVSLVGARKITREIKQCLENLRSIRDENPGNHVFIASFAMQILNPSAAHKERGPQ